MNFKYVCTFDDFYSLVVRYRNDSADRIEINRKHNSRVQGHTTALTVHTYYTYNIM